MCDWIKAKKDVEFNYQFMEEINIINENYVKKNIQAG